MFEIIEIIHNIIKRLCLDEILYVILACYDGSWDSEKLPDPSFIYVITF